MTEYVVYAVDEDYWMPLYVSIYSLLTNNRDRSLEIYVLFAERNETFFDRLGSLEAVHDDVTVEGIRVDETRFRSAPTPHWFTAANLYRFSLGSLLPLSDETVLYLDCDTIVHRSLEDLFTLDLGDSAVAAVPEYKLKSLELGMPVDDLFYNAGVMRIDLTAWEQYDVGERAISQYSSGIEVDFPVQEVLNPILNGDDLWTPLHPKYNAMTNWAEVLDAETNERPVIVHFTGREKPWQYTTERPYKDLWWDYLDETPYSDYRPPDRTISNRLIKTRNRLASSLVETLEHRLEPYSRVYDTAETAYRLLSG